MHDLEHDIDEFDEDYKSKTDIKREMHELQDLALKIFRLSKSQRSKLPLNEELRDAMVLADKITITGIAKHLDRHPSADP